MESNVVFVMGRIEDAVCDAVNIVFAIVRPDYQEKADKETLYKGNTNIPLTRAVARCYSFYVMHDKYGFPYSAISKRSGKHINSVIRNVRKVRDGIFFDPIYQHTNVLMLDKLNEGIL